MTTATDEPVPSVPHIPEKPTPTLHYVPAPVVSTDKKTAMVADAMARTKRTAVLVIHGIGSQKPYTTLDQFARGLRRFFGDHATQEVLLRPRAADQNTGEKAWVQAYVRITPAPHADAVIDLYEYYWAPVITGRVSAYQSLLFLLMAALTPFQYLRDNLQIIDEVDPDCKKRSSWLLAGLFRELFRMLFIFIPVIALVGCLYELLASATRMFVHPVSFAQVFFIHTPSFAQEAFVAATAIRLLLMTMCCIFLFQELTSSRKARNRVRGAGLYSFIIASLLAALYVSPLAKHFIAGVAATLWLGFWGLSPLYRLIACLIIVLALIVLSLASKVLRSAWSRAPAAASCNKAGTFVLFAVFAVGLYVLCFNGASNIRVDVVRLFLLPVFLRWLSVLKFGFLLLAAYIVRGFLTSAIGCLAVYLGADALSQNYAVRSQILHECTEEILQLLESKNANYTYDKVLIAAHSLGSVIAYDSLNELTVRKHALDDRIVSANLSKLSGLLTFGCPLNKVIYFFRTRTSFKTNVLSQILYALHPFRLRTELPPGANPTIALPHPFPPDGPFEKLKWYNAYSPFDLISGRMLFFRADKDLAVEHGVMPWTAHLSYWENNALYNLFGELL